MSYEEEDDFWNSSNVRAFNFDDEEQNQRAASAAEQTAVKTLASVLSAKTSSNEPFLKPSKIICHRRNNIDYVIKHLTDKIPDPVDHKPKQDPRTYITNIVNNQAPIDFSPYKSKRDKLALLDCSICCCDGNLISAVTVFLSKTLKQSIFIEEIRKRPMAVDHYLHYLDISDRQREVLEFSRLIGED